MRYLSVGELIELHRQLLEQSGGAPGIRDLGALESAAAQPEMTFGGQELYPTLVEKAAALGFSLVMNHPFIDGNKRIGHAALETLLVLNDSMLSCSTEEQEQTILKLASGGLPRSEFNEWLSRQVVPRPG